MINLLLAAASLSTAMPVAPVPSLRPVTWGPAADATPAMFVVRDHDTTIYLFGTFHALDGQSDWLSGNLRDAFDDSQELVLETLLPEHRPMSAPAPRPLAADAMAPSASFMASTRLAISAGKTKGMSVNNGADMVLRHMAEDQGKDVEGLETLDSQIRMFNRLPTVAASTRVQPAIAQTVSAASLSNSMSDMQAAWKRGDQTLFVRLIDELRRNAPDTYRMMFTERNARWADWIAARLRTPGTVFVAVGAGHLAGKDSVLVRLAERGIESSRLN
jgi:uncharacterized protein YbaP (TraB family)